MTSEREEPEENPRSELTDIELSRFKDRILEAAAWHLYKQQLAQDPANPIPNLIPQDFTAEDFWARFDKTNPISRVALVHSVVVERWAALTTTTLDFEEVVQTALNGKLFIFDPDLTIDDGAAEANTNGYFHFTDAPPTDTWVAYIVDGARYGKRVMEIAKTQDMSREERKQYYQENPQAEAAWSDFDNYLLAWIPAEDIALVTKGLEVNVVGDINWLENVDNHLATQLITSLQ